MCWASADHYIDFLGTPWPARWSLIVANIWRGIPFVAISLLAGLQTISPSLYEAALLDGASAWQRFRYITLPLLMPILAVVHDLLGASSPSPTSSWSTPSPAAGRSTPPI